MNGQQGSAKSGARQWSSKGRKIEGKLLRRRGNVLDAGIRRVFKDARKRREELDNLIESLKEDE